MKINIIKATGNSEMLELLTAFKVDNMSYVIFDSERVGSMGLPIIYVSKFTGKLEKIDNNSSEWQNVKNYLKGIINGTNFEYIKVDNSMNADEAFYTPLTLPQASFDLIKSRYNVLEEVSVKDVLMGEMPLPSVNIGEVINNESNVGPVPPLSMEDQVSPIINEPINVNPVSPIENNFQVENPVPVSPIIPDNNVISNAQVNSVVIDNPVEPVVEQVYQNDTKPISNSQNLFENDKETFLKACENMFDALVSKYQKDLANMEVREQELKRKEQEIEERLKNATARESVANVAYDNAQSVMDINNFMPNNPNGNQTGVI